MFGDDYGRSVILGTPKKVVKPDVKIEDKKVLEEPIIEDTGKTVLVEDVIEETDEKPTKRGRKKKTE